MNATTIIASTSASTMLTTNATIDNNGNFIKEKRNGFIAATISTTATVLINDAIKNDNLRRIQTKYSTSYVESLSDEELEKALVKMDLLAAKEESENDVKTL